MERERNQLRNELGKCKSPEGPLLTFIPAVFLLLTGRALTILSEPGLALNINRLTVNGFCSLPRAWLAGFPLITTNLRIQGTGKNAGFF